MQITNISPKNKPGKILAINPAPQKTNSTYGNWCVYFGIAVPLGNGKTRGAKCFWTKEKAQKFINEQIVKGVPTC